MRPHVGGMVAASAGETPSAKSPRRPTTAARHRGRDLQHSQRCEPTEPKDGLCQHPLGSHGNKMGGAINVLMPAGGDDGALPASMNLIVVRRVAEGAARALFVSFVREALGRPHTARGDAQQEAAEVGRAAQAQ